MGAHTHTHTTLTLREAEAISVLIAFFLICCTRSEKSKPGFHESVFSSLHALRDKEFSVFDETLKQARYDFNKKFELTI